MSRTFHLTCCETNQHVWVGQGYAQMATFYSGDRKTMDSLGRFLVATMGKPLVLMDSEGDETDEFEGDPNDR